jgi:hypothetical protein
LTFFAGRRITLAVEIINMQLFIPIDFCEALGQKNKTITINMIHNFGVLYNEIVNFSIIILLILYFTKNDRTNNISGAAMN